jgi:hypothetical protein
MDTRRIGHGIIDALSGLPFFATAPFFRHWHLRWGATDEECADHAGRHREERNDADHR